jgi:predicted DNA-binding transcriptional regulator AlpA
MTEPERFALSADEAAAYIGMSRSWLWSSDIPRVRLGRSVKWLREDLEQYLRNHRTHGGEAA